MCPRKSGATLHTIAKARAWTTPCFSICPLYCRQRPPPAHPPAPFLRVVGICGFPWRLVQRRLSTRDQQSSVDLRGVARGTQLQEMLPEALPGLTSRCDLRRPHEGVLRAPAGSNLAAIIWLLGA